MLAVYVSGHGFGHLTRTCEVLREVRLRSAGLPITVSTAAPEWLVTAAVAPPVTVRSLLCDVGLAQKDALAIDEEGTVERCRAFDAGFEALAAEEARFLRESGARLVLGDVPALAFAAAARAGVPAFGLANFSWDWIYRHLASRHPALLASAERAARAYAGAELLLALPFAGDLSAFPRREEVGLVARRPSVARGEARRRLGLENEQRPVALLSFGGIGLPGLSRERLAAQGLCALFPEDLPHHRLAALGLAYEDVVGAADAAVTKPGYGIVTDAIGARTPLVYTDRGDFPEYPIMVAEMGRYLPSVHVSQETLRGGLIGEAIERARTLSWPAEAADTGGAARAAERILERLG